MAYLWNTETNNGNALPRVSRSIQCDLDGVPSTETSVTRGIGGNGTALTPTPRSNNDSQVSTRDRAPQLKLSLQSPNGSSPSPIPQVMTWWPHPLNFSSPQNNPLPRYMARINSIASKEGDIYVMGGSTLKGDVWRIQRREGIFECFELETISEGPSPRCNYACLLVGNAFIVFGGCVLAGNDPVDTTLYLLNTRSRQWSRVICANPLGGRYGHTLNILGSKLYVFGGQVKDRFFNDLVAFDLNQLQNARHNWEPRAQGPPARADHTIVSFDGNLYLFGGRNAQRKFNDVWVYDSRGNAWTELSCNGPRPTPRICHAATIINDMMFIFGGIVFDIKEGSGDLFAFSITRRCWYSFNTNDTLYPLFGHSMMAIGTQIIVMGGILEGDGEDAESSMAYILDTSGIQYDVKSVQTAARDRNSAGQVIQNALDTLWIKEKLHGNPPSRVNQKSYLASPETVIQQQLPGTNPTLHQLHHSASQQEIRRKLPTGRKEWRFPGEMGQSPSSLGEAGVETQRKTTAGDHGIPAQMSASKQEASLHQEHSVPKLEPAVGHPHSPIPPRIRSAVDLVRDTYRETEAVPGFTKHVVWESNRSAGQRRVRREELWKRERKLGDGAFGLIWLESCTKGKDPGSLRAVKEIAKSPTSTKIEYERELEALAKFSNKNYVHCFVHFFGWWESPTAIFISMEYAPDGDLQKLMTVPFPESITWEIVDQILEGLEFMHENGFTHRDLKPLNILVLQQSPTWWVKITDFGISKRALESTALRSVVGTRGYIAPEVMDYVKVSGAQDTSYTSAVDIWALGEITFRLITHQSTFPTDGALSRYAEARIPFPYVELDRVGASKEIKKFLEKAMAAQPSQRLSARDARRHPWIARSRPPSQQPIPNPSLAQKSAEEEETLGEPSAQWSTTINSSFTTIRNLGVPFI